MPNTKSSSVFTFSKVSPVEVQKLLNSCDVGKGIGLDKISNKILKISSPYISISLAEIFNLSLESNVFSTDWKIAKLIHILKNGEKCESNNYRTISVISAVARIFERLVYGQLERYITKFAKSQTVWLPVTVFNSDCNARSY